MHSPEMKKAPAATGAIKTVNPIQYQEKEVTMTSSLPSMPQHFDTSISVAGITIAPNELIGGGEPAETVVTINTREELLTFTPSQACAVAAALQAVAVHVMESEEVGA